MSNDLNALATLSPRELDLSTDPKVKAAREKYKRQARELEIEVEVVFGDKELLLDQLSHFVLSERQELLVKALQTARSEPEKSVRAILLSIPMSALEFLNILREVRTAFSDFKTKSVIDRHKPGVVEAVMKGALPKTNTCMDCEGKGKVVVDEKKGTTKLCKPCFGTGKITKEPEHERQITALEISGVLKKGGAAVEVNIANNSGDGWRSSPDFRRETDKLMYGAVVDAVAIPVSSTPPVSQALPEQPAAEEAKMDASETPGIASGPEETPVVLGGEKEKGKEGKKRNMRPRGMPAPITYVNNKPILVPKE